MLRRHVLSIAAALTAASLLPARAANAVAPLDAPPEAVVKALYDVGDTNDAMTEKAQRDRYFTPATADLLVKTFAKSDKLSEPGIDYEPIIDGQEGDPQGLTLTKTETGDKATVVAKFTSYDEEISVTFDMERIKGVWKIANITGREFDGGKSDLVQTMKDFLKP